MRSITATPQSLGHAPSRDAVSALSVYVFLLFAIPSRLVVPTLGAAGSPAQIFGLLAAGAWLATWLGRRQPLGGPPASTSRAALVLGLAVMASYVAATSRPISGEELRAADRGLLALVAWFGVMLVTTDLVPSIERLEVLLRRVVFAGACISWLGLAQFITGDPIVDKISVPGLVTNGGLAGVIDRGGFSRPAATAVHPIEFGVVLSMILPLALHFAFNDVARGRIRRWAPVVAIAVAVPISISRSAIVGCVVALAFLLPTWDRQRRRRTYGSVVALMALLYVTVPGLLGTFRGLFFNISNDGSTTSRTDSYALAGEFIRRAPVFGRGFSTFLPNYRILDNQYLGTLIEIGAVGLVVLLLLFVAGIGTAESARRGTSDPCVRSLAQSLAASVAAAAVSFATFDALGFPMVPGLLFLLLGASSALRRLVRRPDPALVGAR